MGRRGGILGPAVVADMCEHGCVHAFTPHLCTASPPSFRCNVLARAAGVTAADFTSDREATLKQTLASALSADEAEIELTFTDLAGGGVMMTVRIRTPSAAGVAGLTGSLQARCWQCQ